MAKKQKFDPGLVDDAKSNFNRLACYTKICLQSELLCHQFYEFISVSGVCHANGTGKISYHSPVSQHKLSRIFRTFGNDHLDELVLSLDPAATAT